jgi:hypothetical protein
MSEREESLCYHFETKLFDKEGMKKLNISLDYSMTRGIADKMCGRYSTATVTRPSPILCRI